ncbi:MAG: hypothetical protein ACFFC0_05970, partial [Promethearchaeota archaeon]
MKPSSSHRVMVILAVLLLIAVKPTPFEPRVNRTYSEYSLSSDGHGHISGVPYQWQQINGFCH